MAQQDKQLSVFPAFFKVENEVTAVFGNGDEAYAKARLLKNTEARIVAYTDAPEADYAAFLAQHGIEHHQQVEVESAQIHDSIMHGMHS